MNEVGGRGARQKSRGSRIRRESRVLPADSSELSKGASPESRSAFQPPPDIGAPKAELCPSLHRCSRKGNTHARRAAGLARLSLGWGPRHDHCGQAASQRLGHSFGGLCRQAAGVLDSLHSTQGMHVNLPLPTSHFWGSLPDSHRGRCKRGEVQTW